MISLFRNIKNCSRLMVVLPLFSLSSLALAQDSVRCGAELVSKGDSALKLLEHCGQPTTGDSSATNFSEWTYNFGPDRFMLKVTIIQGEVARMENLEEGFVRGEDGERKP